MSKGIFAAASCGMPSHNAYQRQHIICLTKEGYSWQNKSQICGGRQQVDPNRDDVQENALWAVNEANKQQWDLIYEKTIKAETQVVAGCKYYLNLVAKNRGDGVYGEYYAEIWSKPWENFKKLQKFHQVFQANAPQPICN